MIQLSFEIPTEKIKGSAFSPVPTTLLLLVDTHSFSSNYISINVLTILVGLEGIFILFFIISMYYYVSLQFSIRGGSAYCAWTYFFTMDMQLFKMLSGLQQSRSFGLPEWPNPFYLIHVPSWHSKENAYLTVLECQGCLGFLFCLGLGIFWLVSGFYCVVSFIYFLIKIDLLWSLFYFLGVICSYSGF